MSRPAFLLSTAALLVGGLGSLATAPQALAAPAGYELAWSDEFDGATLDLNKWEHRLPGVRRGGYNTASAVSVANGEARITTTYNSVLDRYETGMIGTQPTFQQTYGYYEARIRVQENIGHWSAFWLQSPTIHDVSSPADPGTNGTEIDVMEYRSHLTGSVQHALHWNGYGSGHQMTSKSVSPANFAANGPWHTFGLLWTPEAYTFFVDGAMTWQTTTALSHRSQYLVLSLEVPDPANSGEVSWAGGSPTDTSFPDYIAVDYVRVYAIPEPSAWVLATGGLLGLGLRRRHRAGTGGHPQLG